MKKFYINILLIFLLSINSCGNMTKQNMEQNDQESKTNGNPSCIEMTIPEDPVNEEEIVFFFAGISRRGNDRQGNFRYVLAGDGNLYYVMNEGRAAGIFNQALEKIKKLEEKQQEQIFNFLEERDFFEEDAVVETPENIMVEGGLDHFIIADMAGKKNCVKYAPGNNMENEMGELINQLLREKQ